MFVRKGKTELPYILHFILLRDFQRVVQKPLKALIAKEHKRFSAKKIFLKT